jgi:hypothetical protein
LLLSNSKLLKNVNENSQKSEYKMELCQNVFLTSTEKAKRYLAERRFIHALIPDTDIFPRYTNSRE